MTAPTVLVILAEGFEEIEAVTPVDILWRAGAMVSMASLADGIHVTGRNGLTLVEGAGAMVNGPRTRRPTPMEKRLLVSRRRRPMKRQGE